MRLTSRQVEDYVTDLAELTERYGVVPDLTGGAALALETEPEGSVRFALRGFLPDGRRPPRSVVEIVERWTPRNDAYERTAYRYELIDHERDHRRAFHRHDDGYFGRTFGVVVHEHCESPIRQVRCPHFFGRPVRDGFRAVELLMAVWVSDRPECDALPCLEQL